MIISFGTSFMFCSLQGGSLAAGWAILSGQADAEGGPH